MKASLRPLAASLHEAGLTAPRQNGGNITSPPLAVAALAGMAETGGGREASPRVPVHEEVLCHAAPLP